MYLDLERTKMETGDITGKSSKTKTFELGCIVEKKSTDSFRNWQRREKYISFLAINHYRPTHTQAQSFRCELQIYIEIYLKFVCMCGP